MSLVASIVVGVLFGVAGSYAETNVLLYSEDALNVTVQNKSVELLPSQTLSVPVGFAVAPGEHTYTVQVSSGELLYELPVTVHGKRDWSWLWWLVTLPLVAMVYFSWRTVAGSS